LVDLTADNDYDTPKRIIGAKRLSGSNGIIYRIEWNRRKDGFKPKNSVFKSSFLRKLCPDLVLEYYEKKIII